MTYTQTGSDNKQARPASLLDAIKAHSAAEVASFHTPGHKGQAANPAFKGAWGLDVTELPGLDELANPKGVLLDLQNRAANIWSSQSSFVSVNGASGALMAAMLACASRGNKVLLPRNAHRSTVNALVLTGLEPIWYEPKWNSDWNIFTDADADQFSAVVTRHHAELACALVVSPTYSGHMSDIATMAQACHVYDVPLIVDEAHGAHLINGTNMPEGALAQGADLVAHSLHKTLGALTQTGIIHVSNRSLVPPETVRVILNLQQTSSPSYLLLASLEQALAQAEQTTGIAKLAALRHSFARQANAIPTIQICEAGNTELPVDPLHMLVSVRGIDANCLYEQCCQWGVFPEATLGSGVLFLLGVGTRAYEVESLADALEHISVEKRLGRNSAAPSQTPGRPSFGEQVMSPRQAFLSPSKTISAKDAAGAIAAECVAPCPPGVPLVVPGMRVTEEAVSNFPQTHLRVVSESAPRRT